MVSFIPLCVLFTHFKTLLWEGAHSFRQTIKVAMTPDRLKTFAEGSLQPYNIHAHITYSHFSCVWFCVTLWTVAYQAPPSIGFSRQEYWSGLPFPPPEDLQPCNRELKYLQQCEFNLIVQWEPLKVFFFHVNYYFSIIWLEHNYF